MKQGKHSAHCLTHSKHYAVAPLLPWLVLLLFPQENGEGKQSKPPGEGFCCFSFIIFLPRRKPPNSSCFGLQVSRQHLPKPDRPRPAAAPGAAAGGDQGLGVRIGGGGEALPPKDASLGPAQVLPCGPSTGPACFLPSHMVSISECNRQLLAAGSTY